ncbi:putative glycoside hydrolase [Salinispira pacifica]|uniref:Putative glycoside hydrolase n=1 Tax=Salinispira pacifica TaxID=1307761 RepID=V5WCF6_9SPIO|nr:putative glycoside hydrolase [Salinispira pacifica]AHC13468.1 putative glycoside hydrolase [Salinispira pacifica]
MKVHQFLLLIPTVLLLQGCLLNTSAYADTAAPPTSGSELRATGDSSEQSDLPGSGDNGDDPADIPRFLAYPGREYLYLSSDSGQSWRQLDPRAQFSDATYITAAAQNPADPEHIVIGTSYYGLYESRDGGETWQDMDPQAEMDGLYQGTGFYNEISGLAFLPGNDELLIQAGFNGNQYLLNMDSGSFGITENSSVETGYQPEWPIPSRAEENSPLPENFERDEAWAKRRAAASDKYGFYISAYQASSRLDEYVNYAVEHGFNSVVVDFKDDLGLVRYNSQLPVVRDAGTARPLFDAQELIQAFHSKGIYVIARLVVFKDKALYAYNNNAYALWDSRLDEPWGVYRRYEQEATEENPDPEPRIEQVEYWVDPYSEFVRSYNIRLARELESLGVDEIQFDYIRFPSDGLTGDIVTRFLKDDQGRRMHVDRNSQRVRILARFLSEARDQLTIPIGTDVFGFNAWSRMSYLGQDIEVMSHYVDVISPMSYPSHYPRSFFPELSYFDRAQLIYEEGTRRARAITGDRALIRQYVQAFLIGGELRYEEEEYFEYMDRQLHGTIQGGGNGFTLWNNSGRYYMVDREAVRSRIQQAARISLEDSESGVSAD